MGLKYLYYMVVVHIQTSQKGRPEDVQVTAKIPPKKRHKGDKLLPL